MENERIERIERMRIVADLKKDIVFVQNKMNELGKQNIRTGAQIAKISRLHDKIIRLQRTVRQIKKKTRQPTKVLIEKNKKLADSLMRYDYVDRQRVEVYFWNRSYTSFNMHMTVEKIEFFDEELKIEKSLEIEPYSFSKKLIVSLFNPKVPVNKKASGEPEDPEDPQDPEESGDDKRYFGKESEMSAGVLSLKKNFSRIIGDFYNEMEIDYDFESVYLTFVIPRHSFTERHLPFEYILNEFEIVVLLKFDLDYILSIDDYEKLETLVLEKYHVHYAILIRIYYKDKFKLLENN